MVRGHHLCANGLWVHVFSGNNGLVESACAGMGIVEQSGERVLHSSLDPSIGDGTTASYFKHRQGSQFTSEAFLEAVEAVGVDVSMDGRGRWIDNRFIERLWRTVKQEDIYLQDYSDGLTAQMGLSKWFAHYNTERPHQALEYSTPAQLYHNPDSYGAKPAAWRWK